GIMKTVSFLHKFFQVFLFSILFLEIEAVADSLPNGELVPVGGGDNIPLTREKLIVGRRSACDIYLHFPNISGKHCRLAYVNGAWTVRDLDSTNGIKVNGDRVPEKTLMPGDQLTIGKREYKVEYNPGREINDMEVAAEEAAALMGTSLMERAGLDKGRR